MAASGYLQMLQKGAMSGDQPNTGIDAVAQRPTDRQPVNDILFLQEMDLVLPEFQAVDLRRSQKVTINARPKPSSGRKTASL